MEIWQGEQYALPVEILFEDSSAVTPENVDGVRVQVDRVLHEWPDGEIEYSEELGAWLFPLKEAETLTMLAGSRWVQTAVKLGDDIIKSPAFEIEVGRSIIRKRWTSDA